MHLASSGRRFDEVITNIMIDDIRSHYDQDNVLVCMLGDNNFSVDNPDDEVSTILDCAKKVCIEADVTPK